MKTLTCILTALALGAAFATAAEKPAKGERKKRDPEAMFKKLDTDSNGAVSLEEFKSSPRAKRDLAKADEAFKKRDTNNDGALSLDELKAGPKSGRKKNA